MDTQYTEYNFETHVLCHTVCYTVIPEISKLNKMHQWPISVCPLPFVLQEDTDPQIHESLSIENTLWASTVVASGK